MLAVAFFILWFLGETLYNWLAITAHSLSPLPLFPRYTVNVTGEEWPVQPRLLKVREWLKAQGFRQVQALNPFEVFYQHDNEVRQLWSPLFALYRFDRRSPEQVRTSFLFDLVTYRRESNAWRLDLGPLCRFGRDGARTRFALLPAWFDRRPPASAPASATVPAPAAGQP